MFDKPEMGPDIGDPTTLTDKQAKLVRGMFQRWLEFEARKADISFKQSEMFQSAKGQGFDPARLKEAFSDARKDPDTLASDEALRKAYFFAVLPKEAGEADDDDQAEED